MYVELNNKTNTEVMEVKYEALIKPSKPTESLIKIINKKQIKTTKRKSQSLLKKKENIVLSNAGKFSFNIYKFNKVTFQLTRIAQPIVHPCNI